MSLHLVQPLFEISLAHGVNRLLHFRSINRAAMRYELLRHASRRWSRREEHLLRGEPLESLYAGTRGRDRSAHGDRQ